MHVAGQQRPAEPGIWGSSVTDHSSVHEHLFASITVGPPATPSPANHTTQATLKHQLKPAPPSHLAPGTATTPPFRTPHRAPTHTAASNPTADSLTPRPTRVDCRTPATPPPPHPLSSRDSRKVALGLGAVAAYGFPRAVRAGMRCVFSQRRTPLSSVYLSP